jgi:hypothetical protein
VAMWRLLRIAFLTAMACLGVALSGAGVHFWLGAERTTVTFFDTLRAASNDDGLLWCGTPDPLFDRGFILQRTAAAVVVVMGLSLLYLVVAQMEQKREHDSVA